MHPCSQETDCSTVIRAQHNRDNLRAWQRSGEVVLPSRLQLSQSASRFAEAVASQSTQAKTPSPRTQQLRSNCAATAQKQEEEAAAAQSLLEMEVIMTLVDDTPYRTSSPRSLDTMTDLERILGRHTRKTNSPQNICRGWW